MMNKLQKLLAHQLAVSRKWSKFDHTYAQCEPNYCQVAEKIPLVPFTFH